MMLTRFVRIQLAIFLVLSIVGVLVMAIKYVQLPAMMGIGRNTVILQMDSTGGLYRHGNVTYLGKEVGKVTSVSLTPHGVEAKLSVDSGVKIPEDTRVEIRSVSAIGEQYAEFVPQSDGGPYIGDGFRVPTGQIDMPTAIGPILDEANAMLQMVPQDKLDLVVDETFLAFNDSAADLRQLIVSTKEVLQRAQADVDPTMELIRQLGPLLDTQVISADDLRAWVNNLAVFVGQVRQNDPQVRSVLAQAPATMDEATLLFDDISPTMPVLMANTLSMGQVALTYNDSIQQMLVVYPALMGSLQTLVQAAAKDDNKLPLDFHLQLNAPPACTIGYLAPDQRRPPNDVEIPVTPDGIYCQLPQDSPLAVRGARNSPCPGQPGKRAPSPALCEDPVGFVPKGDQTTPFGPPQPQVEGEVPSIYQERLGEMDSAAYDPASGTYVGPDGNSYQDQSLVQDGPAQGWQGMLTGPTR